MEDFDESDWMIKISRKADKSNTYNGSNANISFFINRRTLSESDEFLLLIKKDTLQHKTVVSISFIHFSTYFDHIYIYIYILPDIGLAVRVFANGPGDLGSIPGRVISKTQKMVLDASLLNTQHYKVRIKGKVEQSRERSSALPYTWCSSYRKGSLRDTLDYGR